MTTDISALQLLPEPEMTVAGGHVAWSCQVTCNLLTSDSVPSACCNG